MPAAMPGRAGPDRCTSSASHTGFFDAVGRASLSEVGQVLRHRSAMSTAIDAKVDNGALHPLARSWPGTAPAGADDGARNVMRL
ncbi:site-specific integrase [Mycobacterium haemophilum]